MPGQGTLNNTLIAYSIIPDTVNVYITAWKMQ